MVMALFCWATGIGNWPPTRKLAGWPLITVRFGSARTRARLSGASASITPLKLAPGQSVLPPADAPDATHEIALALAFKVSAGRKPILPMVASDCQLTPRLRTTSRDISAIRTRSVTWIGEATLI